LTWLPETTAEYRQTQITKMKTYTETQSGSETATTEMYPKILTVSDVERIAAALPDKQTTLAYALAIFGHLRYSEAIKLTAESFLRAENGTLFEILVPRRIAFDGQSRLIPIQPNLAKILKLTLPETGPLFTDQGVYRRIRTVAKSLGISWSNSGLRYGCTTYAMAAAVACKYEVATWSGGRNISFNDHILFPVSFADAKKYWQLTFDCGRIASLPVYHRLKLRGRASRATEQPSSRRFLTARANSVLLQQSNRTK
jgi:integrase